MTLEIEKISKNLLSLMEPDASQYISITQNSYQIIISFKNGIFYFNIFHEQTNPIKILQAEISFSSSISKQSLGYMTLSHPIIFTFMQQEISQILFDNSTSNCTIKFHSNSLLFNTENENIKPFLIVLQHMINHYINYSISFLNPEFQEFLNDFFLNPSIQTTNNILIALQSWNNEQNRRNNKTSSINQLFSLINENRNFGMPIQCILNQNWVSNNYQNGVTNIYTIQRSPSSTNQFVEYEVTDSIKLKIEKDQTPPCQTPLICKLDKDESEVTILYSNKDSFFSKINENDEKLFVRDHITKYLYDLYAFSFDCKDIVSCFAFPFRHSLSETLFVAVPKGRKLIIKKDNLQITLSSKVIEQCFTENYEFYFYLTKDQKHGPLFYHKLNLSLNYIKERRASYFTKIDLSNYFQSKKIYVEFNYNSTWHSLTPSILSINFEEGTKDDKNHFSFPQKFIIPRKFIMPDTFEVVWKNDTK